MNKFSAEGLTGVVFLVLGMGVFFYTYNEVEIGSLQEMGPGFFPAIMSIIVAILGGCVTIGSIIKQSQLIEKYNFKAMILVSIGLIFFALLIEKLGLLFAILGLVVVSSFADSKLTIKQKILLFLGLFLIAFLVFNVLLGMPLSAVKGA